MAVHFYPVVILCILSWCCALVYAGVMQLEHPQQAFCEADFGKFMAKMCICFGIKKVSFISWFEKAYRT